MTLSVAMLMAACSKSGSDLPAPAKTEENLKQGKWVVTLFEERGKDETSKFSGYALTFDSNGTFILGSGTQTLNGSWSFEDHSNDNSQPYNKLVLWISGNDAADQLQDDWYVLEVTGDFMRLADDSKNHTEVLELKRI